MPPRGPSDFKSWYRRWAAKLGISPNPDDPQHHYDYRAAFRAGAEPTEESGWHWPSDYKDIGHPNRFVEGRDTKTGQSLQTPGMARDATELNPRLAGPNDFAPGPEQVLWGAVTTPFYERLPEDKQNVIDKALKVAATIAPGVGDVGGWVARNVGPADIPDILGGIGLLYGGWKILARDALENAATTGRTLRVPGRSIWPGPRARALLNPIDEATADAARASGLPLELPPGPEAPKMLYRNDTSEVLRYTDNEGYRSLRGTAFRNAAHDMRHTDRMLNLPAEVKRNLRILDNGNIVDRRTGEVIWDAGWLGDPNTVVRDDVYRHSNEIYITANKGPMGEVEDVTVRGGRSSELSDQLTEALKRAAEINPDPAASIQRGVDKGTIDFMISQSSPAGYQRDIGRTFAAGDDFLQDYWRAKNYSPEEYDKLLRLARERQKLVTEAAELVGPNNTVENAKRATRLHNSANYSYEQMKKILDEGGRFKSTEDIIDNTLRSIGSVEDETARLFSMNSVGNLTPGEWGRLIRTKEGMEVVNRRIRSTDAENLLKSIGKKDLMTPIDRAIYDIEKETAELASIEGATAKIVDDSGMNRLRRLAETHPGPDRPDIIAKTERLQTIRLRLEHLSNRIDAGEELPAALSDEYATLWDEYDKLSNQIFKQLKGD